MSLVECFGCAGMFPRIKGPTHKYMTSCPGCWAAFGQVLAREYSDAAYFEVHRLTVDAYAVQHPGSPSRQSIQSIGVHLIRLALLLEHDLLAERANDAILKAGKGKSSFFWLDPPASSGAITVADVVKAGSVQDHKIIVRKWAEAAWGAWSAHHDTIRTWMKLTGLGPESR